MVRTTLAIMIMVMLTRGSSEAQTEQDLRAQLDRTEAAIVELRQESRHSPEVNRIQEAFNAALMAYEAAERQVPGVADIDREIDALRQQSKALNVRRTELIEAAGSSLDQVRAAREVAKDALRTAISGGIQGLALREQHRHLTDQLVAIVTGATEE